MEHQTELPIRQASKLETRNSLLQVALGLFIEKGFEATNINEIAQEAGVAVGTLYLHFGNKEGLLDAILVNLANSIYALVKEVYEKHLSIQSEDLARMHIEQLVLYVEENNKLASFVLGYALSRHPIGAKIIDFMVSQVEENIRKGQAAGIYRADILPSLAARSEVHMNIGLITWWIEHQDTVSRVEVIDTLVKFRVSGLYKLSR
jgi:AcrR family transcriptional regulator